jgi:hypothetical protein
LVSKEVNCKAHIVKYVFAGQLFEVSELVTILGAIFFRGFLQEPFGASASAGKEMFSSSHP